MCEIKRVKRRSQAPVHLVTDRESLDQISGHKVSGLVVAGIFVSLLPGPQKTLGRFFFQ